MMKKLFCVIAVSMYVFILFSCQDTTNIISNTTTEKPTTIAQIAQNHQATFSFDQLENISFPLGINQQDFIGLEGNNITSSSYYIDNSGNLIIVYNYLAELDPGLYDFTIYQSFGFDRIYVDVLDQFQTYRIINGGFETGDLSGWTANTIFKGETNLLSFRDEMVTQNNGNNTVYNGDGNYLYGFDYSEFANSSLLTERIGCLTSSDFVLGGSGIISFKLGAGGNSDLSYMSVIDRDTNTEIARYGNILYNSDTLNILQDNINQIQLFKYYADLSDYLGDTLYIQFYDYGGWEDDYLLIDSVDTYNSSIPKDAIEAINIKPTFNQNFVTNQLANGDFSENLNMWTVSNYGRAFINDIQNCFINDDGVLKSNLQGDVSRGLIRSSLFRVDGSGIISLQIGAAQGERYDKDTYISIRVYGTNIEVFRLANRNHNGINMMTYYVDLSEYLGQKLYFEIVDNATASYDTIFVDNIITYYNEKPIYDFSQEAVNLNY